MFQYFLLTLLCGVLVGGNGGGQVGKTTARAVIKLTTPAPIIKQICNKTCPVGIRCINVEVPCNPPMDCIEVVSTCIHIDCGSTPAPPTTPNACNGKNEMKFRCQFCNDTCGATRICSELCPPLGHGQCRCIDGFCRLNGNCIAIKSFTTAKPRG